MSFLYAFLIGGFVCMLAQILILKTNWTPARILVSFVLIGAVLQAVGWFTPIKEFAGSGITVPITGFGAGLVKGAMDAVDKYGFFGVLSGGLTAVAAGVGVAIVSGLLVALIFKSRSK
jgi:stage V sporulation protein AE